MNFFRSLMLGTLILLNQSILCMDQLSTTANSSSSPDYTKKNIEEFVGTEILNLIKEIKAEDIPQRTRLILADQLTQAIYAKFSAQRSQVPMAFPVQMYFPVQMLVPSPQASTNSYTEYSQQFGIQLRSFFERIGNLRLDCAKQLVTYGENAYNTREPYQGALAKSLIRLFQVIEFSQDPLFRSDSKWHWGRLLNIVPSSHGFAGGPYAHWVEDQAQYQNFVNLDSIAGSWVNFIFMCQEQINLTEKNAGLDTKKAPGIDQEKWGRIQLPDENLLRCLKEYSQAMNGMLELLKEYALRKAFSAEFVNTWSECINLCSSLLQGDSLDVSRLKSNLSSDGLPVPVIKFG